MTETTPYLYTTQEQRLTHGSIAGITLAVLLISSILVGLITLFVKARKRSRHNSSYRWSAVRFRTRISGRDLGPVVLPLRPPDHVQVGDGLYAVPGMQRGTNVGTIEASSPRKDEHDDGGEGSGGAQPLDRYLVGEDLYTAPTRLNEAGESPALSLDRYLVGEDLYTAPTRLNEAGESPAQSLDRYLVGEDLYTAPTRLNEAGESSTLTLDRYLVGEDLYTTPTRLNDGAGKSSGVTQTLGRYQVGQDLYTAPKRSISCRYDKECWKMWVCSPFFIHYLNWGNYYRCWGQEHVDLVAKVNGIWCWWRKLFMCSDLHHFARLVRKSVSLFRLRNITKDIMKVHKSQHKMSADLLFNVLYENTTTYELIHILQIIEMVNVLKKEKQNKNRKERKNKKTGRWVLFYFKQSLRAWMEKRLFYAAHNNIVPSCSEMFSSSKKVHRFIASPEKNKLRNPNLWLWNMTCALSWILTDCKCEWLDHTHVRRAWLQNSRTMMKDIMKWFKVKGDCVRWLSGRSLL